MRAFVTVGSTKFDDLVQTALSPQVLLALRQKDFTELVIQCGNSDPGPGMVLRPDQQTEIDMEGIRVTLWRFKPLIQSDIVCADLVISHAGSGTILDVLRLGKLLIVVPNPTLLDNHQEELASALSAQGYLRHSTTKNLSQAIAEFGMMKAPQFPPFDGSVFRAIVDETMGY